MNTPTVYTPASVVQCASENQAGLPDGRWVALRPLGWQGISLRHRIRCAWLVFTGRADVLRWEGDQ